MPKDRGGDWALKPCASRSAFGVAHELRPGVGQQNLEGERMEDSVKEELLKSDGQFRSLAEEHQDCEKKLTEIHSKSLLSEEDEMEIKRLKVHKLALKDQMESLARSSEAQPVA
ncbi:MAG: YdcH family protein [Acidobacteriota bacterium]